MAIDSGVIQFGRSVISDVTSNKVTTVYDYAFGQYLGYQDYFDAVSQLQSEVLATGVVTLPTGETADIQTVGGSLAVQILLEALETRKESITGLTKLGLKNENKLWSMR